MCARCSSIRRSRPLPAIICMNFRTVLYWACRLRWIMSRPSRTVAGPMLQSTARISSSALVGRGRSLRISSNLLLVTRSYVEKILRPMVNSLPSDKLSNRKLTHYRMIADLRFQIGKAEGSQIFDLQSTIYNLKSAMCFRDLAMLPTVEPIDPQPDQQPPEETQPRKIRQPDHRQYAEEHTQHGGDNPAGGPEAAMPVRVPVPQNDDAEGHQHKRKQRAYVRQIGKCSNVQNPCRDSNHESCNPGCRCGGTEARMYSSKQFRQEPVSRHRKPHPRLPQLKHQERRDHSHHGAE